MSISYSPDQLAELDSRAMMSLEPDETGKVHPLANRWAHRAVGVILAGGQARRMEGRDKPLVKIAGKPMLDHVSHRLEDQVGTMVINANGDPKRFASPLPVISDVIEGFVGPLAGVLSAMRWAQDNAPHAYWVISAAVDTPFFPQNLVDRLVGAMGGPEPAIVLAQSGEHVHPTFGLWPIALADDLEAFLKQGDRKVRLWAEQHICSNAVFSGHEIDGIEIDPFFNVNTPEDIEIAEAIADGLAEQAKT